jgi:DNA-binding HxlR family transcriptional regulator
MPEEPKYNWGIEAALDVVGGKWKPLILYALKDGTLRFSQVQNRVKPHITQRMLTKELRKLEVDGLISRHVYPQVPPKVEYTLTENGRSIIPILDLLCEWGEEHLGERIKYWCDEEEGES